MLCNIFYINKTCKISGQAFFTHCLWHELCKLSCQKVLVVTCFFVCLQLLGELLLDRHNFTVMTKYISNTANLKLMMDLLRDKSRNIQFEAFHVFKVKSLQMWLLPLPGSSNTEMGRTLSYSQNVCYFTYTLWHLGTNVVIYQCTMYGFLWSISFQYPHLYAMFPACESKLFKVLSVIYIWSNFLLWVPAFFSLNKLECRNI